MTRLFCSVMLLIVAAACAAKGSNLSETERQAVADTVRQIAMRIQTNTNALAVDSQMAIWANDPDVIFASDITLVYGPQAIQEVLTTAYGGFRTMNFRWDTLSVAVLSRDAAVVSARGRGRFVNGAGLSDSSTVSATYAFARRDQQWRLVHGHASHAAWTP